MGQVSNKDQQKGREQERKKRCHVIPAKMCGLVKLEPPKDTQNSNICKEIHIRIIIFGMLIFGGVNHGKWSTSPESV